MLSKKITNLILVASMTSLNVTNAMADEISSVHNYSKNNQETYNTMNLESSVSDFEINKETGTIIKYIGNSKEIIIPSEINGVLITNIGEYAFADYQNKKV